MSTLSTEKRIEILEEKVLILQVALAALLKELGYLHTAAKVNEALDNVK